MIRRIKSDLFDHRGIASLISFERCFMLEKQYSPPHTVKKFDTDQISEAISYFNENGYVVFRNSFDIDQGEYFWRDVENALNSGIPIKFSHYGTIYTNPDVPLEGFKIPRIIDAESPIQKFLRGSNTLRFCG